MESDSPVNWENVSLADLVVYAIGGDWGKALDFEDQEYVPVRCIRASEMKKWEDERGITAALRKVKQASLTRRELMAGDIILEVSGGGPEQPVGRTVLIDEHCLDINPDTPKICTNFFRLLRSSFNVDSAYLNQYLQHFHAGSEIKKYQGGSNNLRNLRFQDYLTISVPLPPLNEQRRIVAKIEELFSELDKGVENLKTARAQLKTYRQSLLKAAFEGRLTEQWRRDNADKLETPDQLLQRIREEREARYQQQLEGWNAAVAEWEADGKPGKKPRKPSAPKLQPAFAQSEIEEFSVIPASWAWVRFGDLDIDLRRGPFGSAIKKSMFVPSGYKVYEQGNAIAKDELAGEYFISEEKFHELEGFSVEEGDFIVSCAGTVGRIFELPTDSPSGVINQALMRIRVNETVISRKFFQTLFESEHFQRWILKDAKGTAMSNLAGIKELRLVPVAYCSVEEQEQIARLLDEKLSMIGRQERELEAALTQTEALRQSILKRAFEGKLVPQDPDDEPASALLERIRQEQADAPKPRRRKRKARASI